MPRPARIYTRLARSAAGIGTYRSLWLGPDHLMIVTSTGYAEEYVRIAFRDIQGLFTIRSDRLAYWNIPWLILTAIGALITIFAFFGNTSLPAGIVILLLGLACLAGNYALGPTCTVMLLTGIQQVKLPAVVRRRKAAKVIERLRPLVEAAQAGMAVPPP